jgi:hypothetical protein
MAGYVGMRLHKLMLIGIICMLIVLTLTPAYPAFGQGQENRVRLIQLDASEFPLVTVNLVALDSDFNVITDLSGLKLTEDGIAVRDIFSKTLLVGAEVIFVVDANTDIEERDERGGPSRREKIRDSISRFVDQYMDADRLDRVSVIVPDEQSGRFLGEPGMEFQNAVKNAVNFYQPTELGDTPLNDMMKMALQQAAIGAEEGRAPVIVLFSDSGQLNEQLDFEELVDQSQESQSVIHVAILGTSADSWEIDDAERLTGPTGGTHVHMPEAGDADPLFDLIRDRSVTTQLTYRSSINAGGEHTLAAEVDGNTGEVAFEVVIAPPELSMSIDNTKVIVRVAQEATTPLEDVEPRTQPLGAELSWPDGHPRELSSVTLLVDGVPRSPRFPVLDPSGLLTFDWDIRELDSGLYAIQVQVEDELGLTGLSDPIPVVIEVERPVIHPTDTPIPTPTTVPTPVPVPTPIPAPTPLIDLVRDNAFFLGAGAGIFMLIVVVIIVLLLLLRGLRRRREKPAEGYVPPAAPLSGSAATGQTFAGVPGFALSPLTGAYLEALENAPEHANLIPLSGSNIALGRDPKVSQISFNDLSVSALHARILESLGSYRIYDEGSTSGTYVNFQRIGLTPRVLNNRDEIHLGRVHLRFHLVLPPEEPENDREAEYGTRNDETISTRGDSGLTIS